MLSHQSADSENVAGSNGGGVNLQSVESNLFLISIVQYTEQLGRHLHCLSFAAVRLAGDI